MYHNRSLFTLACSTRSAAPPPEAPHALGVDCHFLMPTADTRFCKTRPPACVAARANLALAAETFAAEPFAARFKLRFQMAVEAKTKAAMKKGSTTSELSTNL